MSLKINEKAILVTLNIGQYTGRKQDKKAERSVESNFNAHDAGTYHKATIAKDAIDKVSKAVSECRSYFYENTLPWTDAKHRIGEGKRLRSMEGYFEFVAELRKRQAIINQEIETFLINYPDLIEEAKQRLNGLFNPKDYPPIDELREKFYFEVTFEPIPEMGDIRVNLQQDELDRLNADLDNRNKEFLREAMRDPFVRLSEVIKHAQERLSDPKAIFRDSLIDNIVSLLKILPSLNITQDPTLDSLRKEVSEKLTKYSADTLRDSETARQETAQNANDLLKKMEGLY